MAWGAGWLATFFLVVVAIDWLPEDEREFEWEFLKAHILELAQMLLFLWPLFWVLLPWELFLYFTEEQ